MNAIDIDVAKKCLPALIDDVLRGEDVVLSRDGQPIARITRLLFRPKRAIQYGLLKRDGVVPDDFDAPLPRAVLSTFEGC